MAANHIHYVPWPPLLDWLRVVHDQPSNVALAHLIGVTERTVCRWNKAGRLPDTMADAILTNLNTHPTVVYGTRWHGIEYVSQLLADLAEYGEAA